MVSMGMVHMAVVKIILVIAMLDFGVATIVAVFVIVIFMSFAV